MKFTLTKRNLILLAFMGFYASCGREDIFDDRGDLMARAGHEPLHHELVEGEENGPDSA